MKKQKKKIKMMAKTIHLMKIKMQIKLSKPPVDTVHDVIEFFQLRCNGC